MKSTATLPDQSPLRAALLAQATVAGDFATFEFLRRVYDGGIRAPVKGKKA